MVGALRLLKGMQFQLGWGGRKQVGILGATVPLLILYAKAVGGQLRRL